MSIMTRFVKLCKADIHGVMDQLEDKGLLLKQYLRDMEEELTRKESGLKKIIASRDKAKRDHEKYVREIDKLEQDLAIAVEKDKDDIGRFLIKKIKPLNAHKEELERHMESLDREIAHLRGCVEEQRRQYDQLQLKSSEFFNRMERDRWEKTLAGIHPCSASFEPSEEEIEMELLRRKEQTKGGKS